MEKGKNSIITLVGDGKLSFQISESQIPKNSLLHTLLYCSIKKTQQRVLAEDTIYLPFSDGVMMLIKMFFFEKNNQGQFCPKETLGWPDPYSMDNISDFLPIREEDLNVIQYPAFLVTHDFPTHLQTSDHVSLNLCGFNWQKVKFNKKMNHGYISTSLIKALHAKPDLILLPIINHKMYPTATFIWALSLFLLFPFTLDITEKVVSFTNDFRIVKKMLKQLTEEKKRKKNMNKFQIPLCRKLDLLKSLNVEISQSLDRINKYDFSQMDENQTMSLALPILNQMCQYFSLMVIVKKKKKSKLYKNLPADIRKRVEQIARKMDTFDRFFVTDVLLLYNKYRNRSTDKSKDTSIAKYFNYKNCKCVPALFDYSLEDLLQLLKSGYNGCDCEYDTLSYGSLLDTCIFSTNI